ncbi:MAG TPA: hypothetical protein PLL55_02320 [Candidatus Aminicenantes bacterium]|nr:hypothetical protein [Candidatus Aminicenantes bacterium]HPH42864.1 hypothetical protein [Candidatus Aminicenantes bacterium]HPN15794.1 hypothetical protein [Candidatus Aminicenantes bacterium]
MEFSRLLVGLAVCLWAFVIGFSIVAFGQILLAVREIALNTRKEEGKSHHGHYAILLVMAKINTVLGWIVVVGGLAAGIYVIVFGVPAFTGLTTPVVDSAYLRP